MEEKESILPETRPENRPQKWSLQATLRWVVVVLIAFGLGALLIAITLYLPVQKKFDKANTDLEHANATLASQGDQIKTLQASNETLQKSQDSAALHMNVLKALSGVRGASLAAAVGDYAGARLSLTQASAVLDSLPGMLGADHKDVLSAMQKSAAQALTDMQTDLKSAQPELDQLTKNLVQLEDNLFPGP